jgi:hypothetical protein
VVKPKLELNWTGFLAIAFVGLFAFLFAISIVAIFFVGRLTKGDAQPDIVVKSSGPTITQLQSLGELVVLKISVSDVLQAEGKGYKGAWLIKGDALMAIDLRKATFQNADQTSRRLTVVLPQPKLIQPRVDHEKTKTWEVSKTTWVPFGGNPDALRDETMLQAQKLVNHACGKEDIVEQARYNTKLLISHMYRFIDWEVDVLWQESEK